MQKNLDHEAHDLENLITAGLELVTLDDLSAAFGGEGLATDTQAQPATSGPSTLMCPSW
ncbi:MAG: hypothetical protein R3B09_00750 [Nannocystaceae bacterium]